MGLLGQTLAGPWSALFTPLRSPEQISKRVVTLPRQVLSEGEECDPHYPDVWGQAAELCGGHFWARGYWVLTVGRDEVAVRLHIQQQEQEDKRLDQLGLFGGEGR